MTLFEFLTVALSIVLALSAGQLLTNIREVFDPNRRYWIHTLWVIHLLVTHVIIWWSFWAYRDVESWNLATFSVALLPPGILLVCTSTLVPTYASTVASWEAHFFEVRRWFLAARSLLMISAGFRTWLLLDTPVLESPTPVSGLILLLCIAGILIPDRRFQGALSVVLLALVVGGVAYFRLDAGA